MSLLEAMGYGLPVIATDVGGIPQLLKEGSGGFVCKPGDADAMADAYSSIMADKETYKAHALNCYETVAREYSFKTHISRLSELYRTVIDGQIT